MDGLPTLATQTPALESTDRAVLRWISGRQTRSRQLTLLTLVPSLSRQNAPEQTVESDRDTLLFAMRMVVTSTLTVWATLPSTDHQ